jgi:hydroxymethylbilane synthase
MAGPSARETLRVGTRGSQLALWQADHVAGRLRASHAGLRVERVIVRTLGDKRPEASLAEIGERGVFTREIEAALRRGSIDLAVHSLKDLPTRIAEGLELGAVLVREDPRDALLSKVAPRLGALPEGSRIGTSSLRRRAQLLALRADLKVLELRGNVPTRLEKLERGECDAIVLARAGLLRLGLEGRIAEVFEPETLLPAVGQGAIGVQIRAGEPRVAGLVAALDHEPTRLATAAERALLARLEGDWSRMSGGAKSCGAARPAMSEGRRRRGPWARPWGSGSFARARPPSWPGCGLDIRAPRGSRPDVPPAHGRGHAGGGAGGVPLGLADRGGARGPSPAHDLHPAPVGLASPG